MIPTNHFKIKYCEQLPVPVIPKPERCENAHNELAANVMLIRPNALATYPVASDAKRPTSPASTQRQNGNSQIFAFKMQLHPTKRHPPTQLPRRGKKNHKARYISHERPMMCSSLTPKRSVKSMFLPNHLPTKHTHTAQRSMWPEKPTDP